MKCFVPPNEPGIVKLSVFVGEERLDDALSHSLFFEYKKVKKERKKR